MSDQFVGEIRIFGCNFAPTGWAQCLGQLLPISQYTAVFSLLGTYYGGNGTSNFALPNLQGNMAVTMGQGQGLSRYYIGQTGGAANVTLLTTEIPFHTHGLPVGTARAETKTPGPGVFLSGDIRGEKPVFVTPGVQAQNSVNMGSSGPAGSSTGHNNMMPYLVMNYCIALQGIFPPQQ